MPITYMVYGFYTRDLEEVATEIGHALGMLFISRRDELLGRTYQAGNPHGENFDIQHNLDDHDDSEWMEPDFREFSSLLYVNLTTRADEIHEMISQRMGDMVKRIRQRDFAHEEQGRSDVEISSNGG
jgi:hypothetical protein